MKIAFHIKIVIHRSKETEGKWEKINNSINFGVFSIQKYTGPIIKINSQKSSSLASYLKDKTIILTRTL